MEEHPDNILYCSGKIIYKDEVVVENNLICAGNIYSLNINKLTDTIAELTKKITLLETKLARLET